ncbi:MAG TPA: helix-turn-helix domain-containing protein [Steroidobacteraceae bacterium]|nr:helix-turn-helix domain-containing protein [Steroidobacteraceae bacterium]
MAAALISALRDTGVGTERHDRTQRSMAPWGEALMLNFLSTALPPSQRAAAYRQALLHYFSYIKDARAEVETDQPDRFSASLEPFAIGGIRGGIHRCNAKHRLFVPGTGATGLELFLLCDGDFTLSDRGGTIELRPGDMTLWPRGTERQTASNRFEAIGFGVPDFLLLHRDLELRDTIGRRIAGNAGLAACIGAFLRKAAESHRELTSEEGSALQKAVLDTICLLGSSAGIRGIPAVPADQEEKLERLQALAMRSLECADLTPAVLAERSGISTRTLHRLFAASGATFQDWLRERRLERCWAELNDRGRHGRSIADVAFGCGFNDLSTFNRAFRARFGMTPRAARENARAVA